MAKSIVDLQRVCMFAKTGTASVADDDQILGEVDVGTCKNGIVVLQVETGGDYTMSDVTIATSATSDFLTAGTAAGSSDLLTVASDARNELVQAFTLLNASVSDLTIASNSIESVTEDGTYVIHVDGLKRFVNIQYSSTNTALLLGAVILAYDAQIAPHQTAETAY